MGLAEHLATQPRWIPRPSRRGARRTRAIAFMTRAATGWGEAAAAGGDDRDAAMSAAARTAAFYTGAEPPA